MKRLLMVVFAPFALVGGALVGYYSHAMRVAENFGWLNITDYPFFLLGLALVLVGFFVRHRVIQEYENAVGQAEAEVISTNERRMETSSQLEAMKDRMQWVEKVITNAVKEEEAMKDVPPEAPSDYVKES